MVCQYDCRIAWLLNDYIHSDHVKRGKQLFSSPYASQCVLLPTEQEREREKCVNQRDDSQLRIIIHSIRCLINLLSETEEEERHTYFLISSK